ncbi:hypothetical protein KM043_010575 [Ampulex compressa]|nr:hypothetical protein KM043_010575 [Ampulex compressa]
MRKDDMAKASLPEQFSLRWNDFSSNLTSGFFTHLAENNLVDVTLAVEGQLLQAHKLVLSVCSPYFKNIFKENPCQHPVVILKDMKYSEIETLLKFMYQGEINIRQEELPTFLKIAQTLQIKGLTGEQNDKLLSCKSNDCIWSKTEKSIEHSEVDTLSTAFKDDGRIQRPKRSQEATKKHTKKKRQATASLEEDTSDLQPKKGSVSSDKEEVLLLSNEDSDDSLDLRKDNNTVDEREGNAEIAENLNRSISSQSMIQDSTPGAVEPVTYRLSARGRPQLVHEGYVYNLTSRSEGLNRSHYRCAEQHRGCRGKCAVIAERFMPTGVHDHNHPPGYQSEYDYRKKKGLDVDTM